MKRTFVLLAATLLVAAFALPAGVAGSAAPQWVQGPGAMAFWDSAIDETTFVESGISIFDQSYSPDHATPALEVSIFQDIYSCTDAGCVDLAVTCATSADVTGSVDWPLSATVAGTAQLREGYFDASGGLHCDGAAVSGPMTFSATWTGDGQLLNQRMPAFVEKESAFEHHVVVDGSIRRAASVSPGDPFGGALILGSGEPWARLFTVAVHATDVCPRATPDPYTGACP